MISPKIQENDAARVEALKQYNIAHTPEEKSYSDIAKLARNICQTEVALVTFIDKDMQWFKAHEGTDIDRNTREFAICSHCINLPKELMYVPDTTQNALLKNNPMVSGPTNIRFYAGIPLLSREGYAIGTICVMHTSPKRLDQDQKDSLHILRNQVMHLLELRRANNELKERESALEALNARLQGFAAAVSHDLKNPLNNISSIAQLLREEIGTGLDEDTARSLDYLVLSSAKLSDLTGSILSYYSKEHLKAENELIELKPMVEQLSDLLSVHGKLHVKIDGEIRFKSKKAAIERIFTNLLTNAVKFTEAEVAEVTISHKENEQRHEFRVSDKGSGIPPKDHQKVFEEGYSLDNGSNRGHGLGLPAVRKIVEDLGGSIHVESKPGNGAAFIFTIKKGD